MIKIFKDKKAAEEKLIDLQSEGWSRCLIRELPVPNEFAAYIAGFDVFLSPCYQTDGGMR